MNCIARDPKARAGSVLAPPDPHAVRHKAGTAGPRPPSVGGWRVARPRVDSRRRIPRLLQHCSGRLRAILPAWESCQKVGRNNARGMRERLLPPTSPVCSAVPQIFSSHLLRRDTLLLRSSIFLRKRALWLRRAVSRYHLEMHTSDMYVVSTAGTRFAPLCHYSCGIVGEGAGPRWLSSRCVELMTG